MQSRIYITAFVLALILVGEIPLFAVEETMSGKGEIFRSCEMRVSPNPQANGEINFQRKIAVIPAAEQIAFFNACPDYGPSDTITPGVLNAGSTRTVDLTVGKSAPGQVSDTSTFPGLQLAEAWTLLTLAPFEPKLPSSHYCAVEYIATQFNL